MVYHVIQGWSRSRSQLFSSQGSMKVLEVKLAILPRTLMYWTPMTHDITTQVAFVPRHNEDSLGRKGSIHLWSLARDYTIPHEDIVRRLFLSVPIQLFTRLSWASPYHCSRRSQDGSNANSDINNTDERWNMLVLYDWLSLVKQSS